VLSAFLHVHATAVEQLMSALSEIGTWLLVVYVSMVALIDIRTQRIPNALSATAAVLGLSLQVSVNGAPGVLSALGGAAVGLGMFLPFYVLRAFGAGDVKAMATVGIFLGGPGTLLAVAFTLVSGAILGVMVLLFSSGAASALYRLAGIAAAPVSSLRDRRTASSQPRRFAYGGAIAIGTLAAVLTSSAAQASF
jgi:prepilin peptidase CpaA